MSNKTYPDKANGSIGSVIISNNLTDRLGYLQFENPDLPEGAIIDRGVFKFFVHELHYAPTAKLNIGPVIGDWDEGTLSWNNKPTINQTQAIEAQITLDDPGWREIMITYLVRQWDEGIIENKGIFLYPLGFLYGTAETNFAFSFKSKEGAEKPKLEVEYHLPSDPTPTQTTTPTPKTTLTPGEQATGSPTPQAQNLTPTPEATSEATKSGGLSFNLSTGQAIIAGTILLALLGALIAFVTYFSRQSQPKEKKSEEDKTPKEEKKKEEEEA